MSFVFDAIRWADNSHARVGSRVHKTPFIYKGRDFSHIAEVLLFSAWITGGLLLLSLIGLAIFIADWFSKHMDVLDKIFFWTLAFIACFMVYAFLEWIWPKKVKKESER